MSGEVRPFLELGAGLAHERQTVGLDYFMGEAIKNVERHKCPEDAIAVVLGSIEYDYLERFWITALIGSVVAFRDLLRTTNNPEEVLEEIKVILRAWGVKRNDEAAKRLLALSRKAD